MGKPLYMSAPEAAEYVGIGINCLREFMNSSDPPPMLLIGKKRYLQVSGLEHYFERKQITIERR
jgi:hypothetical protein